MQPREELKTSRGEDFILFFKWLFKRIKFRFQKKTYTLGYDDFPRLSAFIKLCNWLTPKFGTKKWFQKYVEPALAGKPGRDHIQTKVVPLNAMVKNNPKAVMPYKLIDEVIEKSSFRLILHDCMCRKGMGCKDYPQDFGCMFIGEGARFLMQSENPPGRSATVKETKAHIRKAGELGLVPLAAYVPIEQKIFGVPNELHEKFFEFCFCDPCCCIGLKNIQYLSAKSRRVTKILENVGFTAKALPDCRGCFKCVSICPVHAINKNGTKVWVNEDECVGCGLCQYTCKFNSIQLVQIAPVRGDLFDYFDGLNLDVG